MAARTVRKPQGQPLPQKPIACYPEGRFAVAVNVNGVCNDRTVMEMYRSSTENCSVTSRLGGCSCAEGMDGDECSRVKRPFRSNRFALPIVAKTLGTLEAQGPIEQIIPHLDLHGLEDYRSADVILASAQNKTLVSYLKTREEVNILYPGSGSHMAPLLMAFHWLDHGVNKPINLTYTEISHLARERVRLHLNFMKSHGIIKKLNESEINISVTNGTSITIFTFEYKGKPVRLTFKLNDGAAGEYWVTEEDMRSSDLIIVHDSYEEDKTISGLLNHLAEMARTDVGGKERFVLMSNEELSEGGNEEIFIPQYDSDAELVSYWPYIAGTYGYSYYVRENLELKRLSENNLRFEISRQIESLPSYKVRRKGGAVFSALDSYFGYYGCAGKEILYYYAPVIVEQNGRLLGTHGDHIREKSDLHVTGRSDMGAVLLSFGAEDWMVETTGSRECLMPKRPINFPRR